MPARPCLTCQRLTTNGTRCDPCRRAKVRTRSAQRGTRTEQGYGNDWLRLRDSILIRDGHRCHYCGNPATTADHVVPRSKGGADDPSNLVACCLPCNSSKRDRPTVPRLT